ncbi:DUF3089 domain-containing protein [Sphingosinicella rhizophila]|uniref:DUF3089 domain-containing protein n=1 Tax=Sphingosinicella rhizophila TaxID=3050082 RepID=A0ABU3Q415_9SPHN|nr:DUF3089 domain-containing protein [Sphingosinicella sp. GR2756]MDT9597799.1 DUF3089 domain-containing protein [Sphingosinicella sp. GR2756]
MARRFLMIVAGLVVLVVVAAFGYRLFEQRLMRTALVPTISFESAKSPPSGPKGYADAGMWIARPDIANNPALWTPAGYRPAALPVASVFFIHPTSFLERSQWNAPLDDTDSQVRARLFVRSQASAFNGIGAIWAPKYRQATFGAFLTTQEDARKALDFAYRDIVDAYEEFLREAPSNSPIILAAHSQGSLHLARLLGERVAGSAEADRIAAAYVVGWPISVTADLPALGLPPCETPQQSGCILSWQAFSEPADPKMITNVYNASTSASGIRRAGTPMLCVNPLTGRLGGDAPASANRGTLVPNAKLTDGRLRTPGVPARCDPHGFLLIGDDSPKLGPYVLPGNNYHVYDYALFWANIRADAELRLARFLTR